MIFMKKQESDYFASATLLLVSFGFVAIIILVEFTNINLQAENTQIKDNYADLWCKGQSYEIENRTPMIMGVQYQANENWTISIISGKSYIVETETRNFERGQYLSEENMIECYSFKKGCSEIEKSETFDFPKSATNE